MCEEYIRTDKARPHKVNLLISGHNGFAPRRWQAGSAQRKAHHLKALARSARLLENILDRFQHDSSYYAKNGLTPDVSQFGWGSVSFSRYRHGPNEIISFMIYLSANMEQIQRMLAGALRSFLCSGPSFFRGSTSTCCRWQALKDHKIIQSHVAKGNCMTIASWRPFFDG